MTSARWPRLTGAVVAALDTPDLPRMLSELLRAVAPFSYTVMFGYRGTACPITLHDDFPAEKRQVFVTDYLEGPYLLDPFYQAAVLSIAPGLYRLREVAPDRFYQGEYFRNYYIQTGLAEEIGYFVDMPQRAMLVVLLMRAEKPFSQKDFQSLADLFPFVAAIARRHWGGLGHRFGEDTRTSGHDGLQRRMAHVFGRFGDGLLTPREREIAEFTLRGHSADSAGQRLGISPGTVRIHRRNLYAKLRIHSQGELFSRFLETLVDLP